MADSIVKSSPKKGSPSRSPSKKIHIELDTSNIDNQCDISSTNILDTTHGILSSDFDDSPKDVLKFKYSRRKALKTNFGTLKKIGINKFKIEIKEPNDEDIGKTFFIGPDCSSA